jgi:hypothetical protein
MCISSAWRGHNTATIQTQVTRQTVLQSNLDNHAIEIDVGWNTAFPDKNYVPVNSASCFRGGSPVYDTFQESGFRDIETVGLAVVLNLLPGAALNDVMIVYSIAYEP